jgi:hypothetical protein
MRTKSFAFILFLIGTFSCGKKPFAEYQKACRLEKPVVHNAFSKIRKSKKVEPIKETPQLYAKVIRRDLYSVPEIRLPDPFNSFQALYKLFPGTYYPTDNSEIAVSWWKAPNTKKKKMPDWASPWNPYEWVHTFPWPESQTEYLATHKYTNSKGEECILLSTQTTEFSSGVIHCGRTQGAVLGMALFIKEGNEWVLKKFNPAIGCYGNFASACEPHKAKTQNGEEIFHFTSANGGAGGPYIGNEFIIIPTDTSFMEAHVIRNSCRWWAFTEWDTNVEFKTDTAKFPVMIATTEGQVDGEDARMDDDWKALPPDVIKYAKHHYKFKFREVKEYYWINGKYELSVTTSYVWNKAWKVID